MFLEITCLNKKSIIVFYKFKPTNTLDINKLTQFLISTLKRQYKSSQFT